MEVKEMMSHLNVWAVVLFAPVWLSPSQIQGPRAEGDLVPLIEGCRNEAERCGPDRIRVFLGRGANPNARSPHGLPVLQLAVATGLGEDSLRVLLDAGADVNGTDPQGKTALMNAVQNCSGSDQTFVPEVVRLLLGRGADVNARNGDGWTALMVAAYQGATRECLRLLLTSGADGSLAGRKGETALSLAKAEAERFRAYPDLLPQRQANVALLQTSSVSSSPGNKDKGLPPGLPVPYVAENVCPYEGCNFGEWVADDELPIYAREGDKASRIGVIRKDDVFTALRGNVRTLRPPAIEVTKPYSMEVVDEKGRTTVVPLRPGQVLYSVAYEGEGRYRIWHAGRVFTVDGFWDGPTSQLADPAGIIRDQGTPSEWWVQVRTRRGQVGWVIKQ